MDVDYPAAHSMDTEWFAVDHDGQVALFRSGENGSVPDGAPQGDIDALLKALGGKRTLGEMDYDWDEAFPELARLGLHVYEDDSQWFSGPYVRTHRPERPLHVDQLPPQLREQVKVVRFDDLRFVDKDVLQPCDHAEGFAWPPAYLSEDRQTVRPVPGEEAEFRQAMERMRQEYPEEYEKYRIEGLEEKPNPRKRRRKGDAGK
jgi:hypothetical protein